MLAGVGAVNLHLIHRHRAKGDVGGNLEKAWAS